MNRGGPQRQTGGTGNRANPTRPTPTNNQPARGNEGRHIPREFKEQFLKKLQFCSTPLDFNDETKHTKEKADRQAHLQ